jgi:hypothetical protein
VDDVGVDLLRHHRKTALLPGQPGGPVGERRRSGDYARPRREPLVTFLVGPLADHGEVRARSFERGDQTVNVPAERPSVGWHVGRIN